MKTLTSRQLRELYLSFFAQRGHAIIPSASLIPENDPTVLFTTAGMHPLVPYLMGAKHPAGNRITDVQKCVRTGDIDDVGDPSHCTFFEMLGNWSLGDYFKNESIAYSWEFLTDEKYLGIDPNRLYFTCFEGDANAPRDTVAHDRWVEMGADPSHIFYLEKKHNWWGPAGMTGPCGPDTEIFYDTGKSACGPDCNPSCSCGKYLEIWNNVFMEYNKVADGQFEPLSQKNVDTGMGLDRTIATIQGVESVYDTDAFTLIIAAISRLSGKNYKDSAETIKAFRIVADHIRCATFMLGDPRGVTPSNLDQGYILRRLIRRAIRYAMQLNMPENSLGEIAAAVIEQYGEFYTELAQGRDKILSELSREEKRFQQALRDGINEFDKNQRRHAYENARISGVQAFRLYDTFGFPIEFTMELAAENGLSVDIDGFNAAFHEHQEKSRAGAEQRFKGGLADTGEQTARLHTATHLLQASLRKVLGNTVAQKGSNITAERLRFDFSFERKVTADELCEVERLVNEAIAANVPIDCTEMSLDDAKASGAMGLFGDKYGERVKVYTMGDFSKEICGGPHASSTGELGHLTIKKEEASSAGVRRIKAVLDN
ncbi:MAG: alanine--tRNA ligase [Clostridia bacterium]